jgi:hypothetical protein
MYLYLFHIISVSHESHMLARQMFTVVAIPYMINAKPFSQRRAIPRAQKVYPQISCPKLQKDDL